MIIETKENLRRKKNRIKFTQHTNSMGQNEGSPTRKVHTEKCLHQKFESSQISKSMMCLKPFVKNKQTQKQ